MKKILMKQTAQIFIKENELLLKMQIQFIELYILEDAFQNNSKNFGNIVSL